MENIIKIRIYTENIADVASLRNLLKNNGCLVECYQTNDDDAMGIDVNVLAVVIPAVSGIVATLTGIINTWLKNRTVEFELFNEKTGVKISYKSKQGNLTTEQMKMILQSMTSSTEEKEEE